MSRFENEIKKIRKQKSKYELPLDFAYWTKENQSKLALYYKHIMLKDTIFKNRIVYSIFMIIWIPLSIFHWSFTVVGAAAWAFWGFKSELKIIDNFEKI